MALTERQIKEMEYRGWIRNLIQITDKALQDQEGLRNIVKSAERNLARLEENKRNHSEFEFERKRTVLLGKLEEAKEQYEEAYKSIINKFLEDIDTNKEGFNEIYNVLSSAREDELDKNTVALLNTGVINMRETRELASRFDANVLMSRLIDKHLNESIDVDKLSQEDKNIYFETKSILRNSLKADNNAMEHYGEVERYSIKAVTETNPINKAGGLAGYNALKGALRFTDDAVEE